MSGKNVHVVPHDNGWAIKKEGNQRVSNVYDTKQKAQKLATKYAKSEKVELIIHNKDGRISTKNSYGNDPCPPKDKNR